MFSLFRLCVYPVQKIYPVQHFSFSPDIPDCLRVFDSSTEKKTLKLSLCFSPLVSQSLPSLTLVPFDSSTVRYFDPSRAFPPPASRRRPALDPSPAVSSSAWPSLLLSVQPEPTPLSQFFDGHGKQTVSNHQFNICVEFSHFAANSEFELAGIKMFSCLRCVSFQLISSWFLLP